MPDLKEVIEKLGKAFEEFKVQNDERLAQIEKKGSADPVLEDVTNKLGKTMDELAAMKREIERVEAKASRLPAQGAGSEEEILARDHKKAYVAWMRHGRGDAELREYERKAAINVTTSEDGGYALPELLDRDLLTLLMDESPMRPVCRVITIGGGQYRRLVNVRGASSGWVGESDPRTATDTPQLKQIEPFMGEVYANPQATQTSLDDIFFDVESWLKEELVIEFSTQEGAAFVSGNGTNKPKGFLAYESTAEADGVRDFGKLQYLATGVAGGFKVRSEDAHPADDLIDLKFSLKKGYRVRAVWMLNTNTLAVVNKWKDKEGNYIWRPGLVEGQPDKLLGFPIAENEDMPDVGSGAFPIAFGDFFRGYTIVDRLGTRVLRDPYSNKPYVGFYTTKRVGGMLADSQAIKLLKMSAE